MGILSSLNREQKEAVGLLQIGTFLEYFDLMLYVHMAVLLNELFFPKTDAHTAALLSAFAFCSTYVLRPFGALIFGHIGDNYGRKPTIILTTSMMAVSCLMMANLPTYAQMGIGAAWLVTICRILQGLSSMGEVIGAEIYVTEITKPPAQYPAVSLISLAASLGALGALGVSVLVTKAGFNWRIAFWIGAVVAVVGSVARTRLRETPEFVDMKRRLKYDIEKKHLDEISKAHEVRRQKRLINKGRKEKINKRTFISCFLAFCGWPLSFYLAFMYFNPLLKEIYHYSSEDIIFNNFLLVIILFVFDSIWAFASYKIHPLKILKGRGIACLILTLFFPILLLNCKTAFHIFLLQACVIVLHLAHFPAASVFAKHFHIFKRFKATSFIYALTRAVMYVMTSFGLVFLTELFGHYGLWFIMIPVTISFLWGVNHFVKLEKASGEFLNRKIHHPPLVKAQI